MRRLLPLILSISLALMLGTGAAAKLTFSGESVWRLGYGSGYYSAFGWKLGLGGFIASQEIKLDVEGDITEGLRLEAHIDNTKGDLFQQLTVDLEWEGLWARGGNVAYFPLNPMLGRPKASLMGLSVGYDDRKVTVYATGGRASGSKGSKAFKGGTAQETIHYVEGGPYLPSRSGSGLLSSLEGLWHATTGAEFDPAFDEAGIVMSESSGEGDLADFLEANALGFLLNSPVNPDGPLVAGEFIQNPDVDGLSGVSGAYIVLRGAPDIVLRGVLLNLIRSYNEEAGLFGTAAEKYPYVSGSPTDAAFLSSLLGGWTSFATASKATGEAIAEAPFSAFSRGLIYPLGFASVLADTLVLTALTGEGAEVPLGAVEGTNWVCYEDRGYLEMQLPPGFGEAYSEVAASFSYRLSQGIYFLGAGLIRGSVTARLDGKLLVEGTDYEVDYETGILLLITGSDTGADSVLEVEFEYEVPGSKAWVAGLGISYRPADGVVLSLEYSYGSDAPLTAEDEATVSRERSYEHIVAAWADWYPIEGLKVSAGASFSASAFPGELAKRQNDFNSIRHIARLEDNAGGVWWAFAHTGGVRALSPYGGGWAELKMPGALAGRGVNSSVSNDGRWYFATDAGIAMLEADYAGQGEGFFDLASLWKTAGTRDGLPSSVASSVCVSMGSVFVGTPVGLVEGPEDLSGPWALMRPSEHPELGDGAISGLAPAPSGLIASSGDSIAFYDGAAFLRLASYGAGSMAAADLDSGAYAVGATEDGAVIIGPGLDIMRVGAGREVYSSAGAGQFVFYTCAEGLFAYDLDSLVEVELYGGHPLTAVACDSTVIYAGGKADELYDIALIRADFPSGQPEVIRSPEHGIDGRDLSRFLPKDPAENTLYGAGGYISLAYSSKPFDGKLSVKARGAGSVAGSGLGSPDSASAELSLEWRPIEEVSVKLFEAVEAGRMFTSGIKGGSVDLANRLQAGIGWNGPVVVNLLASYVTRMETGPDPAPSDSTLSGSANLQYSIGALRLVGSLYGSYKPADGSGPYAYAGASAAAYLQAGKNTSISLNYSEPRPFGALLAPSGSYRSVNGSFRYSAYMTYGSLTATARGSYKWDIRNVADVAELNAGFVYAARRMEILGFSMVPRLELNLSYKMPLGADSRVSATAKLSSGTSIGAFGADASYSHSLTYMVESMRLTNSGEASLKAYFYRSGWALKPSLQLDASYLIETPRLAEVSGSWKAGAKLSLSSGGAVSNQASLSYAYSSQKGGKHDLGASDSISFSALSGKMGFGAGISAGITLTQQDLAASTYKASLDASISYKFDKNWSAKLQAEAGLGASSLYAAPKPLYGFELEVALRF